MKKRILSIFLTLTLMASLAACGQGGSSAPDAASTPDSAGKATSEKAEKKPEEITKLNVVYMSTSGVPSEVKLVQDEINNIIRDSIAVEVELMPITWGSYTQQIQLMLAGNEKVDLFVGRGAPFFTYYSNNQLLALDDLLDEHGQGIKEVIEPSFLEGGKINGQLYGITTNRDLAVGYGHYLLREDILKKHDISYESFMTKADIEAIFDQVHEKEPEMLIYAGMAPDAFFNVGSTFDDLGDKFAVLRNFGKDNLTVVNRYKTDEFVDYVKMLRRWFEKGFISPDIASETEPATAIVKSGRAFAYSDMYKPGITTQSANLCGYPMASIQTQESATSTTIVQSIVWCIPSNCERPEKAMQYLNEVYTSADLMNLLSWGIEGKHYVETADGHITFPEGVSSDTSGYNTAAGWLFGNQYLTKVWEGDELDIWDQLKNFNNSSTVSKAMGFAFDTTDYVTEIAAITNVHNEYVTTLGGGLADPDTALPALYEALDKAGIEKLIEGKQAQLDAWVAMK